jgi:pSer/pThr/pTyr-binding forkhead associated (FHA) protein
MHDDTNAEATLTAEVRISWMPRHHRSLFLELADGPGAPAEFRLEKPEIVIGRDEQADVPVVSVKASRRHAVLRLRHDEYVLYDLGSRNGVFLNGLRIHSAVLRVGDVIQVADMVFVYSEG